MKRTSIATMLNSISKKPKIDETTQDDSMCETMPQTTPQTQQVPASRGVNYGKLMSDDDSFMDRKPYPKVSSVVDSIRKAGAKLSDMQTEVIERILCRTIINAVQGKRPGVKDMFVTGGAGSGKSHLLRSLVAAADVLNIKSLIVAHQGIAAINVGGSTIYQSMPKLRRDNGKYPNLQLLIVDEVSMVSNVMLEERISNCLQLWTRTSNKDFGNTTVVFFGDLLQLPPVEDASIFQSYIWRDNIEPLWLTESHRQKDPEFIMNLNMLRESDPRCVHYFNKFVIKPNEAQEWMDAPHIMARRNAVVEHNSRMVNNLVKSMGKILDDFCVTSTTKKLVAKVQGKDALLSEKDVLQIFPEKVHIVPGAQIIFTKNDHESTYMNGDIGVINDVLLDHLCVDKDSKTAKIVPQTVVTVNMARTGKTIMVTKATIRYNIFNNNFMDGEAKGWPFNYGWAITIHKSQGLTLPKVVVDPRGIFAKAQLYVALSRACTPEGLRLKARITGKEIIPNVEAINEYHRLAELTPDYAPEYYKRKTFEIIDDEENEEDEDVEDIDMNAVFATADPSATLAAIHAERRAKKVIARGASAKTTPNVKTVNNVPNVEEDVMPEIDGFSIDTVMCEEKPKYNYKRNNYGANTSSNRKRSYINQRQPKPAEDIKEDDNQCMFAVDSISFN